ncbi:MAG: hypothetical protein IK010_04730 [Bacteroidales bacterium]|nr:hypothetical protein [Bacteroidales bacterium]
MKKAFLLSAIVCALGMMTACKSGTANENTADSSADSTHMQGQPYTDTSMFKKTEDIYVDGNQTEYVFIFRSEGCFYRMLHDVENDSVELENFYIAEDDLGYYCYECSQKLESMGVKYHETSADKTVYCQGGLAYRPQDCCDCGVLIVKPGCQFEFVDLMEFLFGQEDSEQ